MKQDLDMSKPMKKEWDKFKEDINHNRYKQFKGYIFDRLIFKLALVFLIAFLFYFAYSMKFEIDFFHCEGASYYSIDNFSIENTELLCKNPYYSTANLWKSQEYLPTGDYGYNIGASKELWGYLFGIFLLAFLINHGIYNRRQTW